MSDRLFRQTLALVWVRKAFGFESTQPKERAFRLLEEAMELAQAEGCSLDDCQLLLQQVYTRPMGAVSTEMGDVAFTLLAYAQSRSLDLERYEAERLQRALLGDIEMFRRRQNEKHAMGLSVEGIKAKDTK